MSDIGKNAVQASAAYLMVLVWYCFDSSTGIRIRFIRHHFHGSLDCRQEGRDLDAIVSIRKDELSALRRLVNSVAPQKSGHVRIAHGLERSEVLFDDCKQIASERLEFSLKHCL